MGFTLLNFSHPCDNYFTHTRFDWLEADEKSASTRELVLTTFEPIPPDQSPSESFRREVDFPSRADVVFGFIKQFIGRTPRYTRSQTTSLDAEELADLPRQLTHSQAPVLGRTEYRMELPNEQRITTLLFNQAIRERNWTANRSIFQYKRPALGDETFRQTMERVQKWRSAKVSETVPTTLPPTAQPVSQPTLNGQLITASSPEIVKIATDPEDAPIDINQSPVLSANGIQMPQDQQHLKGNRQQMSLFETDPQNQAVPVTNVTHSTEEFASIPKSTLPVSIVTEPTEPDDNKHDTDDNEPRSSSNTTGQNQLLSQNSFRLSNKMRVNKHSR